MGCGSSRHHTRRTVLPDLAFPPICIRNASLTDKQARLIAESWAACIQGTAAWRGYVESPTSESPASSPVDSVGASDLASASVRRSITESPIAFFYDTFYGRLFEVNPTVRSLFRGSLVRQGRMLVRMVGLTVTLLRNVERLEPELESLARRHVAYGVRLEHYGPVGEVLMYTLERCCGPALWTPELATAWLTAYSVILEIMIPAASAEELAAASRLAGGRSGSTFSLCGNHRGGARPSTADAYGGVTPSVSTSNCLRFGGRECPDTGPPADRAGGAVSG